MNGESRVPGCWKAIYTFTSNTQLREGSGVASTPWYLGRQFHPHAHAQVTSSLGGLWGRVGKHWCVVSHQWSGHQPPGVGEVSGDCVVVVAIGPDAGGQLGC